MITINTRTELDEILYGVGSGSPDTLVGVARFGGELLAEALETRFRQITGFFPMGDEGEWIEVDADGIIVGNFLYY